MAAIDFPTSPAVGQYFNAQGKTWVWDGVSWNIEITNFTAVSPSAPINNPNLTGTPTAPTATAGTNTTQIATTQFVSTAVAAVDSTFTRTNLVTNPSFEVNASSFSVGTSGTLSRSTAQAFFGPASGLLTASGSRTAYVGTSLILVTAGQPYTFSVYVRTGSGSFSMSAAVDWQGGSGYISSSFGTSQTITSSGWIRLTMTATAPTGAISAMFYPLSAVTPAAGTLFYVDAFLVEQSSVVGRYFDGSYSDSGINFTSRLWNGTANASTSTITNSVPVQSGNSGKYLTTDGTTTSWGIIDTSSTVPMSLLFGGM